MKQYSDDILKILKMEDLHKRNELSKIERALCLNINSDERRHSTNVYDPIEPHELSLDGELRIDDDPLSGL